MSQPARLTTLAPLTVETAPEGSRTILDQTRSALGMVPNLYAGMANSPGLLSTYAAGYQRFREDSGFDPVEQEIVFLAISRFHECTYCVAVHSAVADLNQVPTDITDAIRDGKPLDDPRLAALNDFTSQVVATRGRPGAEELERFLSVGYTETQVLEIVLAVAVKTISNFTNHFLQTPLDDVFTRRSWLPD
jgi:uncharacterized peroxidase-related enzyme